MLPRLYIALLAACASFLLLGCDSASEKKSSSYSIAAVVSLSGAAAEQGKSWLEGAELALAELRASGESIDFQVEDDATDPLKATQAFVRAVNLGGARFVVGGTWDFLAQASFSQAARYSVPFLTPTNPVELFRDFESSNPFVFSNGLTLAAEKEAIRTVFESKKFKSLALVYPELPWGLSHKKIALELAEELSIETSLDFPFLYESYLDSIKAAALQVRRAGADLVYAPIDHSGIRLLLKEFRRLEIEATLIVSQHLHTAAALDKKPEYYKRVVGIYPAVSDPDFRKRFEAHFSKAPRVFAEAGYDALRFAFQFLKAGMKDRMNGALEYEGITGLHRMSSESPGLVANRAEALVIDQQSAELASFIAG